MIVVPPGGFAGFAQMTPASQRALTPTRGSATGRRRSRKAAGSTVRSRRGKAKGGGGRKLKFGSPAWRKKYAAKAKRNAAKARRK